MPKWLANATASLKFLDAHELLELCLVALLDLLPQLLTRKKKLFVDI